MKEIRRWVMKSIKGNGYYVAQRGGFTMLEVLAVIVIVGLLVAILLPVLAGVMGEAKQAKCISNLRQLGVGINAYVGERGRYPLYVEKRHGRRGVETWEQKIMGVEFPDEPEKSSGQLLGGVFKCPAVKVPKVFRRYSKPYPSYGYNALGLGGEMFERPLGLGGIGEGELGGAWSDWLPPAVQSGSVLAPSKMVAMGPGVRGCAVGIVDDRKVIGRAHVMARRNPHPRLHEKAWERASSRHEGEANLVFVDGHVDSIPLTTLMRGKSDQALSMWNRDGKPHRDRLCH